MRGFFRPYGFFLLAGAALLPTPYKLSYPAYFGNRINITEDNPLTVEGVELGRRLFYEKRLSANNSIACASCHQQTHAFADGRASSLEAQAVTPMTDPHEMGQSLDSSVCKLAATAEYNALFAAAFGPAAASSPASAISPDRIIRAITQFERTLISDNSPYDHYIRGEYQPAAAERRGLTLFYGSATTGMSARNAGCANCHGGPQTFNETYHNNGLDSLPQDQGRSGVTGMDYDRGRFRVVTLRNIALTAPYMHDGRFKTLTEVIDHYNEHIQKGPTLSPSLKDTANTPTRLRLTPQEKSDLLAFLNMLTDSAFIADPRFSDPFATATIKQKTNE